MKWSRGCLKLGWPLLAGLVVAGLALAAFAGLAREVCLHQAFSFDQAILNALFALESPGLTRVMEAITASAAVPFAGLLAILLGLWWWRTARADALAPIVALAGAFALNLAAKAIFARARPTLHPALVQALGYSFPSGHSQAALALYGTLAYLLARRVAPPRRFWIYGAGAAWTLLVGASRAYLEVHYPSDVLAAYAITLPWVLAVILAHHCLASPATRVPASAESR